MVWEIVLIISAWWYLRIKLFRWRAGSFGCMIKLQYGFLRLGYFVTGRYRTTIQSVPRGGSNCSIRVRTAILGVPRGEGGVRVRVRGFELTRGVRTVRYQFELASYVCFGGDGGGSSSLSSRSGVFFLAGGGVRVGVRVRGFELSSLEGRGGEEFEFEFEVGRFAFRWGGGTRVRGFEVLLPNRPN